MLAQLGESAQQGSADLETYRAAFDAASRRDTEADAVAVAWVPPAPSSSQSLPSPENTNGADGRPAAGEAAPPTPIAIVTPSYLLPASAADVMIHLARYAGLGADETAPIFEPPTAAALPFQPASASAKASAAEPLVATTTPTRTRVIDADVTLPPTGASQSALMPFIQSLRAEAAALTATARQRASAPRAGAATVELRMAVGVDSDDTLPPMVGAKATLPFRHESAPDASVDETAFVARDQVFAPATPFSTSPDSLTLEQYADFLGELSRDPRKAAEARVRHGIADEAAQRAAGARFAAEFARDPSMRARFDVMLARARQTRR